MKRISLLGLTLAPAALFTSQDAVKTDIVQGTVNFIIFAAILWYLIADKIKTFFTNRTLSIQTELDKVQKTLKTSQDKATDVQKKLEEARKLAVEIIEGTKADIDSVKQKVTVAAGADITNLSRNSEEIMKTETSKAKKQVVAEVLEELSSSKDIKLT